MLPQVLCNCVTAKAIVDLTMFIKKHHLYRIFIHHEPVIKCHGIDRCCGFIKFKIKVREIF